MNRLRGAWAAAFFSYAAVLVAQDPPKPPDQPLPFSHKTHTTVARLACADCHAGPVKFGDPVGLPPASKCMACHVLVAKDKPAIQKLAEFAKAGQPIPWARVHSLPDFVFFDHRYHLQNEAKCEDCHGPVGQRDVVSNELNATKMSFCQGCHFKMKAAGGCNTCHNRQ